MNPELDGELVVRVAASGDRTVVTAAGTLDYSNSGDLGRILDSVLAGRAPQVVLDLDRVGHVDSTGLALLVTADERARALGGWLRLTGLTGQMLRLLRTTNLDRRLVLYDTLDEALGDSGAE